MSPLTEVISVLGWPIRIWPKTVHQPGLNAPQRSRISRTPFVTTTIRSAYFRDPTSVLRWLCCQGPMWN